MSFDEIKGQDRAIKILKHTIVNNHLAQTYLFYGPDGVGKKKTAIAFARALNCLTNENDACGVCISCRKIEQSIHPDVTLLQQDKGDIKIGAIRDIINGMIYRPLEAKKRVVIVDEADKCNIAASNAFLKTLEEPPVDTIIILISSSPDTLPQTVLSRCHKISFSNIPDHIVAEILMNKNGLTQSEAEYIACLADGSIGKAISLSTTDVKQIREDILEGLTNKGNDMSKMFDLSERFSKDEVSFYDALYWIHTYFRDVLILKNHGDKNLLINKDMGGHLSKIADRMTLERLLGIMDLIRSVYKGQERNMNRQLALDVVGITTGENYGS
jgi:DNA polymerase-3 subunit delta'